MLEFLAALVGPGLMLGIGAAAATGAGGFIVGRRTAPRPQVTFRPLVIAGETTAASSFHDHIHEWGEQREGDVHWRCLFPGCTAVGPKIPGAKRAEE